ncbi:hypothetical protein [Rhizohabitans arisaemae]|uniref:hypothetical protein n=1 Tax=Rhizohabitans arisaemae TaxID=2720610 RepID=UPI0024B0901D|nr:hypothetical protein [Rhizohabitans arisaemae]
MIRPRPKPRASAWFTPPRPRHAAHPETERTPRPDQRVWPPPEDPQTQPLAAVPVDGPVPLAAPVALLPPPATTPPLHREHTPPPVYTTPPARTASRARAKTQVRVARPPRPQPGARRLRRAARRGGRPLRFGLQLLAVAALIAGGVGFNWWTTLTSYRAALPAEALHTVATGGQGLLDGARWRASVGPLPNPPASPPGPARTWLLIKLDVVPLDRSGVTAATMPRDLEVRDSTGKAWTAEIVRRPLALRTGRAGRFELVSAVPAKVARDVELVIRSRAYPHDPTGLRFAR